MASPRLAHALVRLLDQIGHKVNSHVAINVSHEALAQMTAMTSYTVSRLLTNWESQGLLRVRREVIEIHSVLHLLGLCKVAVRPQFLTKPSLGSSLAGAPRQFPYFPISRPHRRPGGLQ